MDPAALNAVVDAFRQAQDANYAAVSALALVSYDVCLTQTWEVKHIWGARWSFPKAMYIFCRYYALAHIGIALKVGSSTSNTIFLCDAYLRVNGFGPQVLALVTDALIIMRLRSMYRKSTKVTVTLLLLFIVHMTAETVVVTFATANPAIPAPSPLLDALPGCIYKNRVPHYLLAVWVPSLSFATLLFGITLYKLWEFQQEGSKASGLFLLFARDGAMFFAMIFCVLLLATLTTAVAPHGRLSDIGVPWLVAVYGIVTSRLILNVRDYSAATQLSVDAQSGGDQAPGWA